MFRVTAIKSLLGLGLGVSGKRLRSGFGLQVRELAGQDWTRVGKDHVKVQVQVSFRERSQSGIGLQKRPCFGFVAKNRAVLDLIKNVQWCHEVSTCPHWLCSLLNCKPTTILSTCSCKRPVNSETLQKKMQICVDFSTLSSLNLFILVLLSFVCLFY